MTVAAEQPADDVAAQWIASAVANVRARRWLVAATTALFLLGAVVYLRTADYTYWSELRIAPAPGSSREAPNIGALAGLASLAGAAIDAAPVTPFRLYTDGIYTREVATRLAADPALMHRIFADEWDAGGNRWHEPSGALHGLRNGLYALFGLPVRPWSPPDAARLQGWIATHVALIQTPKTPIASMGLATTDREFGKAFLLRLHATTDGWLRERTLARARVNITYLSQRLPTVLLADHRQALFVTLSDQQQREMTASNPAPYAAEPFGRPTVSAAPTAPRQLLVLGMALVAGVTVGIVLALLLPGRAATMLLSRRTTTMLP